MGFLGGLLGSYREKMERHAKLPFLKACMAASALVATADGKVSFPERVRVDQIMQTLDALKVFDPHEGVDLFKDYADAIFEHEKEGRQAAYDIIAEVADDPECMELVLRVCLAISEANGEKALADQIEIVSLCSRFGIEPKNCGLYVDQLLG